MHIRHITDDMVDRYAMDVLAGELLAEVEEHLLGCALCQHRVDEADEFLKVFRAAAVQPNARPVPKPPRKWPLGTIYWGTAAAAATLLIVLTAPNRPERDLSPPVLEMQSLRGPETVPHMAPGRPFLLRFDVFPAAPEIAYEVEIVDADGNQVLTTVAVTKDGRLAASIGKLPSGIYWVRVYRDRPMRDLRAEYGLNVE
jgi:hypothetical protein